MKVRMFWNMVMVTCLAAALFCMPVFAAGSSAKKTSDTAAAGDSESYRIIKVYQMDGVVTITGKNGNFKTAYQGMNLSSGDTVKTGKDSHLYLKIDNDKYLMAEPDTVFTLVAEGTAKNSKTQIVITTGSVLSRLDEKLNQNSSYEVKTSNATMAFRGTLSKTKSVKGPDQSVITETQVYEGNIEMTLINQKAGSSSSYQLKPGTALNLNTSAAGAAKVEESQVNYNVLDAETVSFLVDAAKAGKTLSISIEELQELEAEKMAEKLKEEQAKKNQQSSGSGSDPVDKSDWATDEEPERQGTAEELPDD